MNVRRVCVTYSMRGNSLWLDALGAEHKFGGFCRLEHEEIAVEARGKHVSIVVAESYGRNVTVVLVVRPPGPVRSQGTEGLLVRQQVDTNGAVLESHHSLPSVSTAMFRQ